jgi:ketosteroid isomerase-like protein
MGVFLNDQLFWRSGMTRKLAILITLLTFLSSPVLADDAGDVRATIERHYAAINSQDSDTISSHHLEDFTIFPADGGLLVEPDERAVSERMGSTFDGLDGALNVGMTNFNAQIYDNVALATFFLVGTETRGDKTRDITNRVSAVWVKVGREWKEAHHHESQLLPSRHKH